MRLVGLLALLVTGSVAFAGEYAVLSNGARLRVDRHEIDGGKVRLYNASGFIEMDAAQVASYGTFEDPKPVAPPPPVAPLPVAETPKSPLELADAAAAKYG